MPVVASAARKGPAGSRWWAFQGESHSISEVRLAGGGSMSQWGKAQPPGSEPARSLLRAEQLLCAGQLGHTLPFNPQKLHRRDLALLTAPHGGREGAEARRSEAAQPVSGKAGPGAQVCLTSKCAPVPESSTREHGLRAAEAGPGEGRRQVAPQSPPAKGLWARTSSGLLTRGPHTGWVETLTVGLKFLLSESLHWACR